jgi:hypothetical protein
VSAIKWSANNIGGFSRKVRVVALTPRLASHEVNLVAAQEPSDILDVNISEGPGQKRPGAACETFGPRFIQQLQNPLIGTDCSRTGSSQIRKQLVTVVSPESKLTNR